MNQPDHISLDDLRHLTIPLPYPDKPQESLSIQSQIVGYLDTVQQRTADLKGAQNETDKDMDELRFSAVEKGLKGEL